MSQFTHASTVCSNIVLQRLGARSGLRVNEGCRDLLENPRQNCYRLFNQACQKIPLLVPRRFSFRVPERIDASGALLYDFRDGNTAAEKIQRDYGVDIRNEA